MVVGFDNAFNSNFCGDTFDNNFLEKRIFGRNFVVSIRNIFFGNESSSMDYLSTSNGNWWVEFGDE